ncbi:unknown [Eubacterium sp. CAG:786]|nr:unknown [Eubacterium sp. CAG:786]
MESRIREHVEHHLVNLVVCVALYEQVALGGQDVVLICTAAGSGVYKRSPLYEGPACVSVVGVVRNSVCVVADKLQILNEFLGCGGELLNACFLPDALIVADTACYGTEVCDTVNLAVAHLLVSPVVLLAHLCEGTERLEEVAEILYLNGIGDHQNIAVIGGVHHSGNVVCIVCEALVLDLAVVSVFKRLCHLCEGAVLDAVCTVCEHLEGQTVSRGAVGVVVVGVGTCVAACVGTCVAACVGLVSARRSCAGTTVGVGARSQAEYRACGKNACHDLSEFH